MRETTARAFAPRHGSCPRPTVRPLVSLGVKSGAPTIKTCDGCDRMRRAARSPRQVLEELRLPTAFPGDLRAKPELACARARDSARARARGATALARGAGLFAAAPAGARDAPADGSPAGRPRPHPAMSARARHTPPRRRRAIATQPAPSKGHVRRHLGLRPPSKRCPLRLDVTPRRGGQRSYESAARCQSR